jgi:hypothetical protein
MIMLFRMSLQDGWFFAVAVILVAAGLAKIANPAATVRALAHARLPGGRLLNTTAVRLSGIAEVTIGAAALGFGNPVTAAFLAAAYAVFLGVAIRLITVAGAVDCGCFGPASSPIHPAHVVANGVGLAIGVLAIALPPGAVLAVEHRQSSSGFVFFALTLLLSWLGYLFFTALPALFSARKLLERV